MTSPEYPEIVPRQVDTTVDIYLLVGFNGEPDGAPAYAAAFLNEGELRTWLSNDPTRCAAVVKVPIPRSLIVERWKP